MASEQFNFAMVRNGTAQGLLLNGPHRAHAFGVERNIPLVVRCEPEPGLAALYPVFWLEHDQVRIARDGPRLEELKAALAARLFRNGAKDYVKP